MAPAVLLTYKLTALLRSARLQLASTSSARPADTLPRLVAGLCTLSHDLTSSAHIRVLTFCGRNHNKTKRQQPSARSVAKFLEFAEGAAQARAPPA